MQKTLLALFFFTLILFGCKDVTNKENIAVEIEQDSIFFWIKEGRNSTLLKKIRERSLSKAYEGAKKCNDDSLKTKYFSRLSLAYLDFSDSLLFRRANSEAIDLAIKFKDSVALGEANWDLGLFYSSIAYKENAYFHFYKAQNIFQEIGDDYLSGRMYYNMAVVQADVKDYIGSENATFKAIELLKPLNKNRQLYNCYNNLGSITNELREYPKALEYYKIALSYQAKLKRKNTLKLSILNNMGTVYEEQGYYQKAINNFEQVITYDSIYYRDVRLYARAISNLAYNKFMTGDTVDTKKLFKKAISIQDSIKDIEGMARSSHNFSKYHFSKGDTINAIAFANNSKQFSKKSSNNKRLIETLKYFSLIDPKNAPTYNKEYFTLNDSLQQEERKFRDKFARIRYETNEYIAENEFLAKRNQLLASMAIIVFLLGCAAIIIFLQRVKNQKLKFQQQQQESNQEIFDLMLTQKKKVEEGKQSEQKRISEELHDSVVGQMHSVRMLLLGLNKKADETAITLRQDAIEKLKEVQEEVRTISHELNDAAYQKIYNFINSIEDLLKGFKDTEGILTNFEYDDDTDWDQLSGEVKINLYRVIQESLQNCAKHAKAKNVSLSLNTNAEGIVATLIDDGIGFDVRKGKKGIGLKNIHSRIEKINGTWGVTSQSGKGTTVQVQVPSIHIKKELETNQESIQKEA